MRHPLYQLFLFLAAWSFSFVQAEDLKPSTLHPVTEVLAKAGAKDCVARAEQVVRFLTSDAGIEVGAFVFMPTGKQGNDADAISVSFEILSKAGTTYATASFVSPGPGRCHALYETVTHWDASCADVYSKRFSQTKVAGVIRKQINVLTGIGDDARIFLVPNAKGCLVIKKEVIRHPNTTPAKPATSPIKKGEKRADALQKANTPGSSVKKQ